MKSWIYQIIDEENTCIYVGSSTREWFCQRIGDHKKPSNKSNTPLYQYIASHGGWTKFSFKILEELEVLPKKDLLQKEKDYILELLPVCNVVSPITSKEELNKNYRITRKTYRDANPEKMKQYRETQQNNPSTQTRIASRCSTYIDCPCGGRYSLQNKTNHFNRDIHKKYEATKHPTSQGWDSQVCGSA